MGMFMGVFLIGLVFVSGLTIGSFVNVVIHRVPRGQSIVWPPSACPLCGHRLGPAELVPVLSFLIQRGSCRHCHGKISWRYPLIELTTGLFLVVIYLSVSPF